MSAPVREIIKTINSWEVKCFKPKSVKKLNDINISTQHAGGHEQVSTKQHRNVSEPCLKPVFSNI